MPTHLTQRQGGLIVRALDSELSCPGSSTGLGHCVVFLGKTLNSHSASLHPGVLKWVPANCQDNLTKMLAQVTCDRLASHPGGVAILLVASCYGNQSCYFSASLMSHSKGLEMNKPYGHRGLIHSSNYINLFTSPLLSNPSISWLILDVRPV